VALAPIVLSFSGGKDSVLALGRLRGLGWDVRAVLAASIADDHTLVMHGVPEQLVALQAASLAVAFASFAVPRGAANAVYETQLAQALAPFRAAGVRHVAFGDLFLADIKAYRDALMARLGFEPVYPLWGEDTRALAHRFLRDGHRAVTVCVDASRLGPDWAGRELDASFLADLPAGVDPCGENGEFHSFVYDGPGWLYPVQFERSGPRRLGGFHYCDLRPLDASTCARCGATFECGLSAGRGQCWCATLPAVAPDRALATCLCPRCVHAVIAPRGGAAA